MYLHSVGNAIARVSNNLLIIGKCTSLVVVGDNVIFKV